MTKRSIADRFWSKVEKKGENECWEWKGFTKADTGYGSFTIGGHDKIPIPAHRMAYTLTHGKIPAYPETVVMHTCDNRACVNPSHLRLGTQGENLTDSVYKGRYGKRVKLTPSQVDDIRALYWDTGIVTEEALSRLYGVCESQIGHIVNFEQWTRG